jgi:DNA transposition AAA+ family ATPase
LIGADQRTAQFAQLFSRIGLRVNLSKPRKADVTMLLSAWGMEDRQAREIAMGIGLAPGALRVLTKVLRMAGGMAHAAGLARAGAAEIQDAWEQLTQSGKEVA